MMKNGFTKGIDMSNTRKQELLKELKVIEAEEQKTADHKKFKKIVTFLDNADVFLLFIEHSRTSCSDEYTINDYTTAGRGGAFRCDRCGLITASQFWKNNRQYLIETGSGAEIENSLQFIFSGISLKIGTFSED